MIRAQLFWLEDDPALALSALANLLPPDEQVTLTHFRLPARARGFALSRLLLRRTLADRLQRPPQDIRFRREASGRLVPLQDEGWYFSLSHCDGLVALLVADAPCGVDAERPRPARTLAVAGRYFSEEETLMLAALPPAERDTAFFRLWTLKEAAVKALGTGLAGNMAQLAFDLAEEPPRLRTPIPTLQMKQVMVGPCWIAGAIAAAGPVCWERGAATLSFP